MSRSAVLLTCACLLGGACPAPAQDRQVVGAAGPPAADAGGEARAAFERGVAAYRAGDTGAALRAFEAARDLGMDTPQLRFNLGLSYYKERRYREAREAFERLRASAGYEAIADLHLGLVAARLGQRDQAAALWRDVSVAPDPDMRQRADVALGRLSGGARAGTAVYVLAVLGHDGNPALIDEALQGGNAASATAELFGAFDHRFSAAPAASVLRGGGYVRAYAEDNGLDQRGAFVGVGRERSTARSYGAVWLDAAATWLDGEPFTRTITAGAQAGPGVRGGGFGWRGQLSRIAAPAPHGHLEDWRARGTVDWIAAPRRARPRLAYVLEVNDREDLAAGSEFFSHSPVRHALEAAMVQVLSPRWSLRWRARYRASLYRDANRVDDGGVLREERREEQLVEAGLQARRRLDGGRAVLFEYQHSRNAATPDAYDYDRHVLSIAIEWQGR